MNRTQIGGYVRITKKEAARRYNAGEVIRLTACKLSPVSPWGCYPVSKNRTKRASF